VISLLPIGKREAGQADATHFSEVRRRDSTLPLLCARCDGVKVIYPAVVPDSDPFRRAELEHSEGTTKLAYRSWACAAIASCEWRQRLTWSGYRSVTQLRPVLHKTGKVVLSLACRSGSATSTPLDRLGATDCADASQAPRPPNMSQRSDFFCAPRARRFAQPTTKGLDEVGPARLCSGRNGRQARLYRTSRSSLKAVSMEKLEPPVPPLLRVLHCKIIDPCW